MVDVLGIKIPSTSPVFLGLVGLHVVAGLVCVVTGIVAMLSRKERGRHPTFGTIYFCGLVAVFVTATAISAMRWREDYHLFILGSFAFGAALLGRAARSGAWPHWVPVHICGMGSSYVLLLTAFYVDNGKNLPLWKYLPSIAYWTLPAIIAAPIIVWALLSHPLVRQPSKL
ncbi:MAG: DUF2306 domain-containing protein [Alphaproteobacteria bacterium]|nr:DUF2306 domain-containing protein [Alphaproteobacteria bacterium]